MDPNMFKLLPKCWLGMFQKQIYIWIHVVQLCGYFLLGEKRILFPYWHRVGYQWGNLPANWGITQFTTMVGIFTHTPTSSFSEVSHDQSSWVPAKANPTMDPYDIKMQGSSYPGPIVGGYLIIYSPNIYGSSTTWKFVWLLLLWIHGPTKHKFDRMDFPRNCKSLPIGAPPMLGPGWHSHRVKP